MFESPVSHQTQGFGLLQENESKTWAEWPVKITQVKIKFKYSSLACTPSLKCICSKLTASPAKLKTMGYTVTIVLWFLIKHTFGVWCFSCFFLASLQYECKTQEWRWGSWCLEGVLRKRDPFLSSLCPTLKEQLPCCITTAQINSWYKRSWVIS